MQLALEDACPPPPLFNFSHSELGADAAMRAALVPVHARTRFNFFDHVHAAAKGGGGAPVKAPEEPCSPFPDLPGSSDDLEIAERVRLAGAIVPWDTFRLPLELVQTGQWPL